MGGNTYFNMGQRDLHGDGRGSCCNEIQDLYDNRPETIHNASPEIQTNVFNYSAGCEDGGHSDNNPNNPSATSILNSIGCQGKMDDVHCYNGGTLETSPCKCECPQGQYFGENCEYSCIGETPRMDNIRNRIFNDDGHINEQENIDFNSFIEFCQ
jgi:hypothetical protein